MWGRVSKPDHKLLERHAPQNECNASVGEDRVLYSKTLSLFRAAPFILDS